MKTDLAKNLGFAKREAQARLVVDAAGALRVEKIRISEGVEHELYTGPPDHFLKDMIKDSEAELSVIRDLADRGLSWDTILPYAMLEEFRLEFGLYRIMWRNEQGQVLGKYSSSISGDKKYSPLFVVASIAASGIVWLLTHSVLSSSAHFLFFWIMMHLAPSSYRGRDTASGGVTFTLACIFNPFLILFHLHTKYVVDSQERKRERFFGPNKTDGEYHQIPQSEWEAHGLFAVDIDIPDPPADLVPLIAAYQESFGMVHYLLQAEALGVGSRAYPECPIRFVVLEKAGMKFAVLICQYGNVLLEKEKAMMEYIRTLYARRYPTPQPN